VLVKQYQIDPVTHRLIHADFFRVAMDKMLTVTVPVHLEGEAKGVKVQGGTLDFVHRDVDVECLPADIPEQIVLDVTELMIGQGVRVRDLPADGRWKAVSEPDMLIVHVVAPRAEVVAAPEEAAVAAAPAVAAEPEVMKKGKVDKEEKEKEKK
jgi:large subunit ribosomal protein L25